MLKRRSFLKRALGALAVLPLFPTESTASPSDPTKSSSGKSPGPETREQLWARLSEMENGWYTRGRLVLRQSISRKELEAKMRDRLLEETRDRLLEARALYGKGRREYLQAKLSDTITQGLRRIYP